MNKIIINFVLIVSSFVSCGSVLRNNASEQTETLSRPTSSGQNPIQRRSFQPGFDSGFPSYFPDLSSGNWNNGPLEYPFSDPLDGRDYDINRGSDEVNPENSGFTGHASVPVSPPYYKQTNSPLYGIQDQNEIHRVYAEPQNYPYNLNPGQYNHNSYDAYGPGHQNLPQPNYKEQPYLGNNPSHHAQVSPNQYHTQTPIIEFDYQDVYPQYPGSISRPGQPRPMNPIKDSKTVNPSDKPRTTTGPSYTPPFSHSPDPHDQNEENGSSFAKLLVGFSSPTYLKYSIINKSLRDYNNTNPNLEFELKELITQEMVHVKNAIEYGVPIVLPAYFKYIFYDHFYVKTLITQFIKESDSRLNYDANLIEVEYQKDV